jgi:hypothetical protein
MADQNRGPLKIQNDKRVSHSHHRDHRDHRDQGHKSQRNEKVVYKKPERQSEYNRGRRIQESSSSSSEELPTRHHVDRRPPVKKVEKVEKPPRQETQASQQSEEEAFADYMTNDSIPYSERIVAKICRDLQYCVSSKHLNNWRGVLEKEDINKLTDMIKLIEDRPRWKKTKIPPGIKILIQYNVQD